MPEISPSKYLVMAGWNDVPHLDEKAKAELRESTPPHLRDAREFGKPSLGSGAIYPIPESEIVCDPFQVPGHWPMVYALDVGWKRTAAIWGAWDRESDIVYLWSEHYRGNAEPSIHADAIRSRADWIPGVIDPAARGRSQHDGEQLMWKYQQLGLDLVKAKNAVESGIFEVWQRLSSGRLKVFSSNQNTLAEFRLYRRDKKGQVVKENDHLMDCMRYLVMSGLDAATTVPVYVQGNRRSVEGPTGY